MKANRPRLLYVITQGHWGGAQKYVYDLATGLAGKFDVTVAVGDPEGERQLQEKIRDTCLAGRQARCEIRVIHLKRLRRAISPLHDLLAVWEIRKLYKTIKPDIIHLNSSKAGIIGSWARWVMFHESCVMIYTAHGWVFEEPITWIMKTLYRLAEKYTARAKDAIIVLSDGDKTIAREKLAVPINRLALIPNGVNSHAPPLPRAEARRGLHLGADAIVVGTIANHYKTKGLDILLRAVASLKKESADLSVVIIGDGPERPRLETMIEALDLSTCITLAGFLPDAARMLPAFDIFVLPSRKEGSPFTLLEAMSAGLPIIATAVGAAPDIITTGEQGLIIPPGSPDALHSAIKILIEAADERQRLGSNARRRAADFSLTQQIEATTTLYQSLLPRAAEFHQ